MHMQKLSKKIIFRHEGDIYLLFRGKHPMLLKVTDEGFEVIDQYGTPADTEELDRLLKVLWKAYIFRD